MDRFAEIAARVSRLSRLAADGDPDAELLAEINDTLSDGYAWALNADRELVDLDERLVELMLDGDDRHAGEIAVVHARRGVLAGRVERLRDDLARMHDTFVVLTAR